MISCNQHDYIEIVCMYHYPIKLTLRSGDIIQGVALDTQRNKQRDECIKIDIEGVKQLVVLEEIKILEVMVVNPHLQKVTFE
ncbi:MAG TPA: transcriptional regulator [Cellvibrio sp.]|nr:transcriptional regulator [Cellvibrio sp.]